MKAGNLYSYRIISRKENTLEVSLELDDKHPIYAGHFPDQPLTPGVVQVQLIGDILEKERGHKLFLEGSRNIKFTGMLIPGECRDLRASISHVEEAGKVKVQASLQDGENSFLKFRGEYRRDD